MTRTSRITGTMAALAGAVVIVAPALAAGSDATDPVAGSGGAGYGAPVGVVGGPALYARSNGMLGATLNFRGTTTPGRQISIERLDALGAWQPTATAVADAGGGFVARWRTDHIGLFTIRAVGAGDVRGARTADDPPSIKVTVYKPAIATWYGPGFYGKKTACGQRLTTTLVGVAHRGLPCGRSVSIIYKGRTIVAPVVDRGPFRDGATWDLTAAAARQVGLVRTDRIGAVAIQPAPVAARAR
ncbi:MAG TPA: septal ring lytic transglycosylase RlpA family protein [Solirubrobacteraceae bacterium]|nr:septal ring lytic transglycosylase RlpA family protein [Solirubrobacteraceae bacterium]